MKVTWVFIAILIVFSLIKIIPASLPSSVVEKILNKYKIHPQITPENCKVKYGDVQFIGGRKDEIIQYFNDANYLEKYYFAPEKNGEPLVISVTEGKGLPNTACTYLQIILMCTRNKVRKKLPTVYGLLNY